MSVFPKNWFLLKPQLFCFMYVFDVVTKAVKDPSQNSSQFASHNLKSEIELISSKKKVFTVSHQTKSDSKV